MKINNVRIDYMRIHDVRVDNVIIDVDSLSEG